jgi:type I restriction enzyme S subunit
MESVIPKGYRQTDVGPVPADWDVKKLGDIFTIGHGKSQHLIACDYGAYPILGTGGKMGLTNHFLYDKPSVLIGRKGTLDKPQYIDIPFWTIDTLFFTRFNSNYSSKYVFFVAQTIKWSSYSEASGVPSLTGNIIEKIQIPIPPTLTEQTNIAIALSDVDALIENTEKLIAKKADIKQGTMQELLTGKRRLPGFSGEWEAKRLGDVATFFKGKGLPKSALSESGAEPCIHYGELFTRYPETIGYIFSRTDIAEGVFRSVANDVLMPTSDVTPRGLAKASCIRVDGVILGGDILVIRSDKNYVHGSFLSLVIRYEETQVLQLVTGSTVYHLYGSDMKNFIFSMPPLPEQTAIAEVLSNMDAEITTLERDLNKYRDIKQGMMQELLTGRTRLPKEVING